MKKRCLALLLFFGCFFVFTQSTMVFAEPKADDNKIVIREATTNPDTIYQNYKDNSFELLTHENKKGGKIQEVVNNATTMLKTITWGGVKGLGQFNAEMVDFLFSMDVVTPIKKPMLTLTSQIASNMLSIAGTIGIAVVTLIVGIKFIGEQRFRQAFMTFGMAILIFTGLAICKDANSANSLFTTLFEADKAIETEFVSINPVLNEDTPSIDTTYKTRDQNGKEVTAEVSPQGRMKSAGDMISSRVFYTNVYEPYLLMNYGTSNAGKIREKKVKYKDKNYDRINILLDNDVNGEDHKDLQEDVTKYETDDLKNRTIQPYNNVSNTFFGIFYIVVNLIQTVVYFVLCFFRLIISVMQLFLLPLLPILLLVGLFMQGINVFANYFKAFGMTIFMKAVAGFACILFSTILTLGFQLSNAVDSPWQKVLTILIYLLMPLGIYVFRHFLGSLLTGQVSLANAMAFATNPFGTESRMRKTAKNRQKESAERRKQAKEERKAAIKKRKAAMEKRGNTELGLKQKPAKERENKRSALRRELQPQAQHKAPNMAEKTRQNLQERHENAQKQEAKEQQTLAKQRERKAMDKDNLKTAAALAAANQTLRQRNHAKNGTGDSTDTDKNLRQSTRRTGQSSKGRSYNQTTSAHRQGDKQTVGMTTKTNQSGTKQRNTTNARSTARGEQRKNGQKPQTQPIQPKGRHQQRQRTGAGMGGSPKRQAASVRQQKAVVQQVIQQSTPKETSTKESKASVPPSVTRMAKRTAPPPKVKNARNGVSIRRSAKDNGQPKTMKGRKQPRARK